MANAEQLKALVRSHIDRDDQHFYAVAMQVAAREAQVGHTRLANDLRRMIDNARASRRMDKEVPESQTSDFGGHKSARVLSFIRPRTELSELLTVSHPATRVTDMVLDKPVSLSLQRILREQRHHARIREYGLLPRRKLLLVGPPGSGKTMTAAVLAGELGIPLNTVRLDALITKFMGETAAKLRQVFDAMQETRGVYFFDEFDAIGSQRGLSNDVGEIRRVLNSFLLMIESDQSNSLIVAATNHVDILDQALFRRFDDVIEYSLPDVAGIRTFLLARLVRFSPDSTCLDQVARAAEGLSYADIRQAVDDAVKDALMNDLLTVDWTVLLQAVDERRRFALRNPKSQQVN